MSIWDLAVSAFGMAGAVGVGWLSRRSPEWAVALVVASVPLQALARIGTVEAGITWTQAWLWTFLAAGAFLFAVGAVRIRIDLTIMLLAIVVVCYIASRHAVVDERAWRNEVYRWSATFAFFVCARGMLRGHRSPAPLVAITAIGAVWTGIVTIIQVAADVGPASFERSGLTRAHATFGVPNTFGAFAAGCLIVLAACLMFDRGPHVRWWSTSWIAGGCAFAAVGLVLSQSRGAIAAGGAISAVMVLVKLNGLTRVPPVVRVATASTIAVFALLVVTRVADGPGDGRREFEVTRASWANQERLAHWGAAAEMIADSHGLGIGAGQFDSRYRAATPTWRFRISQGHAHDAYLQVAAETGIVGLGAYAGSIAMVLTGLLRCIRRYGATIAPVGALALTGAFLVHNVVDYLHVLNLPIILVAWWAIAFGQSEGSTATT